MQYEEEQDDHDELLSNLPVNRCSVIQNAGNSIIKLLNEMRNESVQYFRKEFSVFPLLAKGTDNNC